jgi:hypothetical protein
VGLKVRLRVGLEVLVSGLRWPVVVAAKIIGLMMVFRIRNACAATMPWRVSERIAWNASCHRQGN